MIILFLIVFIRVFHSTPTAGPLIQLCSNGFTDNYIPNSQFPYILFTKADLPENMPVVLFHNLLPLYKGQKFLPTQNLTSSWLMTHNVKTSGTLNEETFSNNCISTKKMNYSNDSVAKSFVNQVVVNSLLLAKLEDQNQLVS